MVLDSVSDTETASTEIQAFMTALQKSLHLHPNCLHSIQFLVCIRIATIHANQQLKQDSELQNYIDPSVLFKFQLGTRTDTGPSF